MPRARVLADISPLRESRGYRLLFAGQVATYTGRQFTVVAVPIQVFNITHSSLMVAFTTAIPMRPLRPGDGGTKAGLSSVLEGLGFLRGKRVLVSTFTIDINAMVFSMPSALFPQLGAQVFGGGPQTVGFLFAAPGAGALVGALFSGWVPRVRRQGMAVIVAVVLWGAAIAAFGFTEWLPLALILLAVAGAADVVSAVFRNTILQLSLPDAFRGRISGVHIAVVAGGPRLGDAEAGAVAALATPQISVISGGLACIAGALMIARLVPEFAKYDAQKAPVYSAHGPTTATKGDVHG